MLIAGCGARTGLEVPLTPPSRDAGMDAPRPDGGRDSGFDAPDLPGLDAPDAPPDVPLDASMLFLLGCADGEREGFLDPVRHERIAGCGGGFQVPGLLLDLPPRCDRRAGDDGARPNGEGCASADLCAEGWHICLSSDEVAAASPGGCDGVAGGEPAFFATRQSGPGCGICARGDRVCGLGECSEDCRADATPTSAMANDLFGCGTLGDAPRANCAPLDRFSNDLCGSTTAPWSCPGSTGFDEALVVRKNGPERGGVLCCRDDGG